MATHTSLTRRGARRLLTLLALALVALVTAAGPAQAHAELVSSSPANGARLDAAPERITLQFTEDVALVSRGLRLVDERDHAVRAPAARAQGHTVTWPMPRLGRGTYVVSWRVISADGHPVSGAFTFGVESEVAALARGSGESPATAPWWVVAVRLAGYLSFAAMLGVFAFVVFCAPGKEMGRRLEWVMVAGLVGGMLATVAGLLVQGPYVAGTGLGSALDQHRYAQVEATPFGQALEGRLLLLFVLLALIALGWAGSTALRWWVGADLFAAALTFAKGGHSAASGRLVDLVSDVVHVLAASTWVGGLVVLAVLGRQVDVATLRRFGRLAMISVLLLVASGVVNSVVHLQRFSDLVETRYGAVLGVKVLVVGAALAGAALSRRRLATGVAPLRSVRWEAATTVTVVALTSVLTLTSPPAALADASPAATARAQASAPTTTTVRLLGGNTARILLSPPTTGGSQVSVTPVDARGRRLSVRAVTLRASFPAQDVADLEIPLTRGPSAWTGRFRFPLAGTWKLTVTVEDPSLRAVVGAGTVKVARP